MRCGQGCMHGSRVWPCKPKTDSSRASMCPHVSSQHPQKRLASTQAEQTRRTSTHASRAGSLCAPHRANAAVVSVGCAFCTPVGLPDLSPQHHLGTSFTPGRCLFRGNTHEILSGSPRQPTSLRLRIRNRCARIPILSCTKRQECLQDQGTSTD